jgi:ketosteroid isomerase-like protein
MKRFALVLALAIFATPLALARTQDKKTAPPPPPPKAADASVVQTLTKMENDALAAIIKRDVAAFGKIFADDAVLATPDGTLQTKSQLLADIKSGELVIESSSISDMNVKVYGDAAVATYITNDKGKYKGQDITGRYRWTDVFVRRGGAWQIVAGQGTPIPKPAK